MADRFVVTTAGKWFAIRDLNALQPLSGVYETREHAQRIADDLNAEGAS